MEATRCGEHLLVPDVFICPSVPGWPLNVFSTSSLLRVKGAWSCPRQSQGTRSRPGQLGVQSPCLELFWVFQVLGFFFPFLVFFLIVEKPAYCPPQLFPLKNQSVFKMFDIRKHVSMDKPESISRQCSHDPHSERRGILSETQNPVPAVWLWHQTRKAQSN